jgi:N-acetyl-1-D-myo-inositol-2-amino-2-deoxy-alpha-D-glucopyranoside deacetylase
MQINEPSLLAVFAHPDDESISMGGTLAHYARAGVSVNLLCATRGEWGPICDPELATRENLPDVRKSELEAACDILGVRFAGFLGCPDGAVNNTVRTGVEGAIVKHIRRLRPQVVVTFGPDGLYWNSDHIAIGLMTTNAFHLAADAGSSTEHFAEGLGPHRAERLYYVQYPSTLMKELASSIAAAHDTHLWGFEPTTFGVPSETITTTIDIRHVLSEKLRAIRSHKTQLARENIFSLVTDESAERFLAKEYFKLAVSHGGSDANERDLFSGIAHNGSAVARGRVFRRGTKRS